MGTPGSKDPHRHQLTQTFGYEFFCFRLRLKLKKELWKIPQKSRLKEEPAHSKLLVVRDISLKKLMCTLTHTQVCELLAYNKIRFPFKIGDL